MSENPGIGRKISPDESWRNLKGTPSGAKPENAGKKDASTDKSDEAAKTIEQFEVRAPRRRMEDVILPESTRDQVTILLNRIRHHDILYNQWGLAEIDPGGRKVAVNFYGPPGTGKTMLVEALASELGKPIIDVSYAEIESKYVGETGKNIVAAFSKARESGALLFFDEADSILGRRMTNVTQAADQSVNVSRAVMLKQLDAFEGVVAFATNLARNFDGAFVRRIMQHIAVALPDAGCRLKLWQLMLKPQVPGRDGLDWQALADASDGLAGGDIQNAVILSLSEVVARKEESRRVCQPDVMRAIEHVRQAKRDIGRYDYDGDSGGRRRVVASEVIPLENTQEK